MQRDNSKKRLLVKWMVFALLLLLLLFAIVRNLYLNRMYPSPAVETYSRNSIIQLGNYEISLTDWQWSDGEIVHEIYPGYKLIEIDGEEYSTEKERIGLAEVTVTKTKNDNTKLDLTEIAFESGAWGNQFDLELFMKLNPDLDGLVLEMKAGETKKIMFPITMLDLQFSQKSWHDIDERQFYVVVQYYPVKYQLLCQ